MKLIILIAILFISKNIYAKEKKSSVYLGISQPDLTLTVDNNGSENPSDNPHNLSYEPIVPTILVLGGSYGIFSASYSFELDESESSLNYTDYSLSFNSSWVGVNASYSEYEKFRINQFAGFPSNLDENELRRPDLSVLLINADLYIFPIRWNFDFDSAFDPAQEKNNGIGLGFIGGWNKLAIETKEGLIPTDWRDGFGGDGQFVRGDLSGTNGQFVISGVLAFSGFYTSALIALGPGNHHFKYETNTETREGEGFKTKINQKLSLGYSGTRFFTVLAMSEEAPDYELKFMTIGASRLETNLFVGFKF